MKTLRVLWAALVLFAVPVVRAQVSGTFTLTSPVAISNATQNVGAVIGPLSPAKVEHAGVLIMPTLSATNAGTSNVVFTFDVSPDGLTYSTTGPITGEVAANGTNSVTGFVNIWPDDLPNVQYIKLTSVSTTQTNTVTVSSVKWFIISP